MLSPFGLAGFGLYETGANMRQDAEAARDRSRANAKAGSLQRQLRFLEANLAKSLLINETLWELIRDKLNLTEQDLNDKLYQIDMRDGQIDGKNQRKVVECPKCQRKVSPRHPTCIYCGHIVDDTVFAMGS